MANTVVKSPAGYHVLKVLDRRAARASAPPQQVAAPDAGSTTPQNIPITQTLSRHILLRNRPGLSDQGRACGKCDSCRLRKQGFADAGVTDPTRYIPS